MSAWHGGKGSRRTHIPHPLADLSVLDQFKTQAFPPGYPTNHRTFFSPVDDVHGCLKYLISQTQKSLVVAMFGFDDQELADTLRDKLENPHCFVQLTLDQSQSTGKHEQAILTHENYPISSVAVGHSEKGAIMHLKMCILDGVVVARGSTNWSSSGQHLQDNELTIVSDAYIAAEARARVDAIHQSMVNKAKAKR